MNYCHLILAICILLLTSIGCASQSQQRTSTDGKPPTTTTLYQKTYGSPKDPAVVFLHGGPGYNSASFELGAAQALADRGYYVLVYDRRGCGRSQGMPAEYTYDEAEQDLADVLSAAGIGTVTVIGHSFGGAVGMGFGISNPRRVERLILVGAPLDYPATFRTIRRACRAVYQKKADTTNLKYIDMLDAMDTTDLNYAIYCFSHAMACGLYTPAIMDKEAKDIYRSMSKIPDAKYLAISTREPVKGFYDAHRYITTDLSEEMSALVDNVPVYGIYGLEDGLFDEASRTEIAGTVGEERFYVVKGASHSVFIDKREEFLDLVDRIMAER